MDDDGGLNMRNWGYYEPSFKGHLGLQLMSTVTEPLPNLKPTLLFPNGRDINQQDSFVMMGNNNNINNGGMQSRECAVTGSGSEAPNPSMQLDYLRDSWMNQQRDRFLNMFPLNPNFNVLPNQQPSSTVAAAAAAAVAVAQQQQHIQIQQRDRFHNIFQLNPNFNVIPTQPSSSASLAQHQMQILSSNDPSPTPVPPPLSIGIRENEGISNTKKRNSKGSPKAAPKPKKSKKSPKENGSSSSVERVKPAVKKGMEMVINGVNMDISAIPIPVCSCTGFPQQCYRWGCGGWQSACCTTTISTHPLPMSTKRRGARIAGRKMSQGAFKKVLEKLSLEGYNFGNPIDLKKHWAKHGTNKFVTIR